jgi:hypothetical protein
MRASEEYIVSQLYPDVDYRGDTAQTEPMPVVWTGALKYRSAVADIVEFYEYQLDGINATTFNAPVMIVPECGNNQRLKAVILSRNNSILLFPTGDVANQTNPGILSTPRAFLLAAGQIFEYFGAAPLYAICNTVANGFVSVAIESIRTQL